GTDRLPRACLRHLADRRRRRGRRLWLSRLDVADHIRAARPAGRMNMTSAPISRRRFLTGPQPERHHISSAVVLALPARLAEVTAGLHAMRGVEVHAAQGSRIVVTIEGPDSGALGE